MADLYCSERHIHEASGIRWPQIFGVMEDWIGEETTGDFWEAASLSLVCVAETQECDLPSDLVKGVYV